MIVQLISLPFILLQGFLYKSIVIVTCVSILFTLLNLNSVGIIKRLLQIYIEYEVSRSINGAPITISNIQFQILNFKSLRSTIILHDFVIHTPSQNKWRWESPLIARVGYARITVNPFSFIDIPPSWKQCLGIQRKTRSVKDIYTVEIKDVQVFVEKRRNVFNFHLLDERLDLPDADEVIDSLRGLNSLRDTKTSTSTSDGKSDEVISTDAQMQMQMPGASLSQSTSGATVPIEGIAIPKDNISSSSLAVAVAEKTLTSEEEDLEGAKKADELVTSIVKAVSSLGRAANEGGTEGLSNALRNQKDGFVSHLKKVQNMVGLNADNTSGSGKNNVLESKSSGKEKKQNKSIGIAKEGIQVMKQVGKVVEKNVLNMKQQVDTLSKPPPFRQDWKPIEYPDLFRFGFIAFKDARIFTKDIILVPGTEEKSKTGGSGTTNGSTCIEGKKSDGLVSSKKNQLSCQITSALGWSKPILIKEVKLYPSELCAPKDVEDPCAIGQPIDVYSTMILERIFAELATSSISGKMLNNAFSEVFALFDIAGTNTHKSLDSKT